MKMFKAGIVIASTLIATNLYAAENSSNQVSLDVAPTLAINSPDNPSAQGAGAVLTSEWTVTANNAFTYAFTGNSLEDDGSSNAFPRFTKQDVDASGAVIASNYDHLDSKFGVKVTGAQSTQTDATSWAGADVPTGEPTALVSTSGGAPSDATGRIMPGDTSGAANIALYSTGEGSGSTQSGGYSADVTLTVTSDPQ